MSGIDQERLRTLHGLDGHVPQRSRMAAEGSSSSGPWTKPRTVIRQPGAPQRPNTVPNPYSRPSIGSNTMKRPTGNPTAKQTLIGLNVNDFNERPAKRQKTDARNEVFSSNSSRFFPEPKQKNISHSSGTANGISASSGRRAATQSQPQTSFMHQLTRGRSTRVSSIPKHAQQSNIRNRVEAQESDVISLVDEDDLYAPEDIGNPITRPKSHDFDGEDELDSILSPAQLAKDLGVAIPDQDHPFRVQSSPLSSSRTIAQDGTFTSRLRDRLESQSQPKRPTAVSSPNSSLSLSPPQTRAKGTQEVEVVEFAPPEDDIEEIQDADGFPDILSRQTSTQGDQMQRQMSPGGRTSFKPNNVKAKKQIFEGHNRGPSIDLKSKLPTGLTAKMKGKARPAEKLLKAQQIERRQPATKVSASSRPRRPLPRQSHLTSPTAYTDNSRIVLPLEVCVWGPELYELSSTDIKPRHYLYWNNDDKELQLLGGADPNRVSQIRPLESIRFEHLSKAEELTISNDSAVPFMSIVLPFKPQDSNKDESPTVELALKFIAKDNHMLLHWSNFVDAIKKLTGMQGETVFKDGAKSRLEGAKMNRLNYGKIPGLGNRPVIVKKATQAAPALNLEKESALTKSETTRPGAGRPRPAYIGAAKITTTEPSRRSSRLSTADNPVPESHHNSDEIILVYPHSGQGAVNVTKGDVSRLGPSEFLNDTLIELGLKFIMNDLREKSPELAEQIHVFSSFFYKKLNKKNFEEGYKSLRKWTAKVDIFKKKYIIVPINEHVHWYLAVIYHPEHTLEPAPEQPPSRKSGRLSVSASKRGMSEETINSDSRLPLGTTGRPDSPVTMNRDDSDIAVEEVIESTRSCSIDDSDLPENEASMLLELDDNSDFEAADESMDVINFLGQMEGGGPSRRGGNTVPDSEPEDDESQWEGEQIDELQSDNESDDLRYPSDGVEGGSRTPVPPRSHVTDQSDADNVMDVDRPASRNSTIQEDAPGPLDIQRQRSLSIPYQTHVNGFQHDAEQPKPRSRSAVPPTSFYTSKAKRAQLQAESSSPVHAEISMDEIRADEDGTEPVARTETSNQPVTWIFTMDSLGSSHKQACNVLSRYLRMEAMDKKGIDNPSEAKGKQALVPVQPNYCDCGLYLLHFAATFLADPEKYKEAICNPKSTSRKVLMQERNALWLGDKVGTMREDLKARILRESEAWKKFKAEKDREAGACAKEAAPGEDSDDEPEIIEEVRKVASPETKNAGIATRVAKKSAGKRRPRRSPTPVRTESRAVRLR